MKLSVITLLVCCFTSASVAQSLQSAALPEAFQKKLDQGKLIFIKPKGTVEVPVIANAGLAYQYALKIADKNIEVRYFIMPLTKDLFDAYDKRSYIPGDTSVYPNKLYTRLPASIYNKIADGKLYLDRIKLQPMKPKDQGADDGSMFAGPVGPTFGQKYTFGFYAMMHKDFLADVYVLYLFESEEAMQSQIADLLKNSDIIGSIKFKPMIKY